MSDRSATPPRSRSCTAPSPAATRGRRRRRRVRARVLALSADHVAVLALATVAVLLAAITWNRWGDPSYDTGLDLVAGAKVSHADLPYLDFTYWYGPLGPMLLGVVFEVAGIADGPGRRPGPGAGRGAASA